MPKSIRQTPSTATEKALHDEANKCHEALSEVLKVDTDSIKDDLTQLDINAESIKAEYAKYANASKAYYQKLFEAPAPTEAAAEKARRQEAALKCRAILNIIIDLRKSFAADLISNIDTKSLLSKQTKASSTKSTQRSELELELHTKELEEETAKKMEKIKQQELLLKQQELQLQQEKESLEREQEIQVLKLKLNTIDEEEPAENLLDELPIQSAHEKVSSYVLTSAKSTEASTSVSTYTPTTLHSFNTSSITALPFIPSSIIYAPNTQTVPTSHASSSVQCMSTLPGCIQASSVSSSHSCNHPPLLTSTPLTTMHATTLGINLSRPPPPTVAFQLPAPICQSTSAPHGNPSFATVGRDTVANSLMPPSTTHVPPASTLAVDYATNEVWKRELFKKSSEPFSGDPLFFRPWRDMITNEMKNLTLTAMDVIKILIAQTSERPLKLVQDYFAANSGNPDNALKQIWSALNQQFGSSIMVATSLNKKINSFQPIKYSDQNTRVRDLANLCNIINAQIDSCPDLQRLHSSTGLRDIWLKLPAATQNKWRTMGSEYENKHGGLHPPFGVFVQFLEKQAVELSNPNYAVCAGGLQGDRSSARQNARVFQTNVESKNNNKCPIHRTNSHLLEDCKNFLRLTLDDKRKILYENRRCYVCLSHKHSRASECDSDTTCSICSGKHHDAMHIDKTQSYHNKDRKPYKKNGKSFKARQNTGTSKEKDDKEQANPAKPENSALATQAEIEEEEAHCIAVCGDKKKSKSCSRVYLVNLTMPNVSDRTLKCYCIVDEQATCSFVDTTVVDYFGASPPTHEYYLTTLHSKTKTLERGALLDGVKISGVTEKTTFNLPSLYTTQCIPNSKDQVASPQVVKAHKHIAHLARNFPEVDNNADVLLLLGRDCSEVFNVRCHGSTAPYAYKTILGWALVGLVCPNNLNNNNTNTCLKTNVTFNHDHFSAISCLNQPEKRGHLPLSRDVFKEETDDELPGTSREDQQFLKIMSEEIHVNEENHLSMPLPFKNVDPILPNNRQAVFYRTKNTLDRLKKNSKTLAQCTEAMGNSIKSGYIETVPSAELNPESGRAWWLPVFPVSHPKKEKVRLVFDSSANFNGVSLNDVLLQGPDNNNRLRGVLMRFRRGEIGFSTDIEAMFNQFHLHPQDRDYLRFFWFKENNPSLPLVEYRSRVQIFGNRPSPAIANFGLRYTTTHPAAQEYPEAIQFINEHFYVDDGLGSKDTPEEAIKTIQDSRKILKIFNINLHKITSNSDTVISAFPKSDVSSPKNLVEFEDSPIHKTLGVAWNTATDTFVFLVDIPKKPFTRRGILSTVNSLYDPIGFACPIILGGKLIQRAVLADQTSPADKKWDAPLPKDMLDTWTHWKESLTQLKDLSLPRSFTPRNFGKVIHRGLHAFADASDRAIGYVIYLRSVNSDGQVHVAFVTANSKVSPKSATSIPRLELCAALEVSLATTETIQELNLQLEEATLYSDSQVTLGYLQNEERRFSRYVTRRVSLISKSYPASNWKYVRTEENTADIASRPHSPVMLQETRWQLGPKFLWQQEHNKPDLKVTIPLPEVIADQSVLSTVTTTKQHPLSDLINKVSNFNKLKRITVIVVDFIKRFVDHRRQNRGYHLAQRGPTSREEAEELLIKTVQQEAFSDVINDLKCAKTSQSASHHKLMELSPFVSDNGLLRVGGRLRHAPLQYQQRFPLLLPAKHQLTKTIVRHHHSKVYHQGRHITTGAIREAGFFIQSGSKTIREEISKCVPCRHLRRPTETQKMADLPSDRLEEVPPFINSGMDVFGPFQVSDGRATRRTTGTSKMWALIFTCLTSRAVHIEPLPSLDTSKFKNAFRRFICIRGNCKKLRSDRGTNFIAARNINEENFSVAEFKSELETHDCEWTLNPPHASHFGGAWERKIGSVRRILDATLQQLGPRHLDRDEFSTLLQEAASIINNTPLSEISGSPNDPIPISPAMLLTTKKDPNPPQPEQFKTADLLAYGKSRWRRVQQLAEHFWSRWRTEYLSTLQSLSKWKRATRSLQVDDIVLVKIKGQRRNTWPSGRVSSVIPGRDGRVRSVLVDMRDHLQKIRTYERPIVDLVLLIPGDDE